MHRDSLAAGDIADDLFAADGVATARAVDQQVILALDLERLRAPAEEDALDRVGHLAERVADDAGVGSAAGSIAMVEPGSSLLSTWRAEYLPKPTPASSSACVPRPYSAATLS